MIKRVISFSNPAYLSLDNARMSIRKPDEDKPFAVLPIEDIGVVVIDHPRITVTAALLNALLGNNVAVITCGSNHLPVGLQLPLDGNTLQSERYKFQIDASLPLKKQLWQQTVQSKIQNQAAVLHSQRGVEVGNMIAWSKAVRSGDPENLEARAAVYYWKYLYPEFPHFSRKPDGESPNHLLNYGYAILRSLVARSLVATGLLPTLGIHHRNRYNAYCLADDIMEPFRPYVDWAVVDIVKKYEGIKPLKLEDTEIKREMLSIPVMDTIIDGKNRPLMNAVEVAAVSLSQCFQGTRKKIIYPAITIG